MAVRGRPRIIVTVTNRIEIIKMFLLGETRENVASYLNISTAKLSMFIKEGVIPSRKSVLEYKAGDYLSKIGNMLLTNPNLVGIHTTTLISMLNKEGIVTSTGNTWDHNKLKRYFHKKGIRKKNKNSPILGSDLKSLVEKNFYDTFLVSEDLFDVSPYLKSPPKFLIIPPIEVVEKELSPFYQKIKEGVLSALENDCTTVSEIALFLKDLGLKNRADKEITRWSLTLYLEKLGITLPEQKALWGTEILSALIHKIEDFPVGERITGKKLNEMISSLTPDGFKTMRDITVLRGEVSALIKKHNSRVGNLSCIEKWYPLFSKVCNETYRHKIPSYNEIGEALDISPMYAHRLSTRIGFDVCLPYYQSFQILLDSYEDQEENPTLTGLCEFLNNTYLQTPRGAKWTYQLVRLAKINSMKHL